MSNTFYKAMDLTGKVALVTGAGTGIGLTIAKGFAENGAKVYIVGRRFEVVKQASEQDLNGSGQLIPLQMDVTDKESILKVVEHIKKADGKLDVLVNNAGALGPVAPFTPNPNAPEVKSADAYGKALFDSQSFEEWSKLEDLTLAAIFFVTSAFLGLLGASVKGGLENATASVINITSCVTHFDLSQGVFAYLSLKTAAARLGRTLAQDFTLKKIPVRVNSIGPGVFPSQFSGTRESADALAKTNTPAGRAAREVEIAAIAIYLASSASAYTNGQDIAVDGSISLVTA